MHYLQRKDGDKAKRIAKKLALQENNQIASENASK
jgi:hypothetical protein